MSPQLETLLASLRHAAGKGTPATSIGGGIFTPGELSVAIGEIKAMAEKLAPKPKPVPWTLQPWMHVPGNEQFAIIQGERFVTSTFVIENYNRARLERALAWLNEQGAAV
jgi:hypothetical protein